VVAVIAPWFGAYAMAAVIAVASALLAGFAFVRRATLAPAPLPASSMPNDVPVSSVALAESVAAVGAAAQGEGKPVAVPPAAPDER